MNVGQERHKWENKKNTHKESFKSNSIGVGGLFGDCQNKPKEERKAFSTHLFFGFIYTVVAHIIIKLLACDY